MHIAVQALDRATGKVLASLPDVEVSQSSETSPFTLAKQVRSRFTRAGLLSTAEAACALFVPRRLRKIPRRAA